jgi:hypothetical protein
MDPPGHRESRIISLRAASRKYVQPHCSPVVFLHGLQSFPVFGLKFALIDTEQFNHLVCFSRECRPHARTTPLSQPASIRQPRCPRDKLSRDAPNPHHLKAKVTFSTFPKGALEGLGCERGHVVAEGVMWLRKGSLAPTGGPRHMGPCGP